MTEIMTQILSMPPPFNLVAVIVIVSVGVGGITSIAREIRKYASHRESMEVIADLAERGMSADEIERVLNSGPRSYRKNRKVSQV